MEVRYKCVHRGWSGTKYYMPVRVSRISDEARRVIGLALGVIIGMPVMAVICMMAGGML